MPKKANPTQLSKPRHKRKASAMNSNSASDSNPTSSPQRSIKSKLATKLPPKLRNKHTLVLLAFILLFGAIGSYLLIFSHAASVTVATVEAETMTIPSSGASVITDSTASNSQAIKFTANATTTGSISLPSPATSLTVRARGIQCKGAPGFSLSIDGVSLGSKSVTTTSWTDYIYSKGLTAGSHTISTTSSNYGTWKKCARNLFLDKVTFMGETATNPMPTVSLTASPVSVTVGATSNLTWSSTNATSCNASGGWSGMKAVSGTETTGAINANTTYTLSCVGLGGTTAANATVTAGGSGMTDLLNRKDLIYSSEIGAWTKNGTPAVTVSTGIPQKVIDAKMPVIRYAQYDCWTDQRCGSDNHVGTQVRADFDTAMGGIVNNMHAVPWLKLLPIAVGNINSLPNGNVFCPPWTGDATQNQAMYRSQLDQLATIYKGPLIIESNNEMEYACWETWKAQGANIGGAGSADVSKRIGQHFAQNMPQLKKYARSLGFSQVVMVGYIGVGGGGINGDTWGDRCTADATKPYGYACTYNSRWVDEFNRAVHDAYVAAGSNDPDYIPDGEAIHAYVHSPDFIPKTSTSTYEFDDKIAYAYYRNWIVQSRAITKNIWGTAIGDQVRFSISEWQAGASNNDGVWSGWATPSRVQAFYDGWLKMLQGDGNLAGSGTRYWNANVFLLASEEDTGTYKYYNIVRKDGSTPLWYDTFKNISLGDTSAR